MIASLNSRYSATRIFIRIFITLGLVASLVNPISGVTTQKAIAAPTTSDCAQTVGTSANLTVSVVGNDCVLTFTGSSTWTIPSYVRTAQFLIVGGGAGGTGDGGGGGGVGGALYHSNVSLTPNKVANISVGAGGGVAGNGTESKLDLNGDNTYEWNAPGGTAGGGWTSRTGGAGGNTSAQTGALNYSGGRGGDGPSGTNSGQNATNANLGNGNQFSISGTALYYGGGGGGGIASHSNNSPSTLNWDGGAGGYGGGGHGAVQRARGTSVSFGYLTNGSTSVSSVSLNANCQSNTSYPGTTKGFAGLDGFGGGGGGGSAYGDGCGASNGDDGERTDGGIGGKGVAIIRFAFPTNTCDPITTSSGGYTIKTFTSTTTCFWTVPTGITSADILVVGAGGGGGGDGGSGGGGGELRYATNYSVTAGNALSIAVGTGGAPGSWSGGNTAGSAGSFSTIGNNGTTLFLANGGGGGYGWTNQTTVSGGTGGTGGTGTAGQNGGLGPTNCTATSVGSYSYSLGTTPSGTAPSNSISGSLTYYGGGGGAGSGYNLMNTGSSITGVSGGGTNSGGRGSSYKIGRDGSTISGASKGSDGYANSGGGGGGGSACDAYVAYGANLSSNVINEGETFNSGTVGDGQVQRTAGGNGAAGVVIIRYANAPSLTLSISTLNTFLNTAVSANPYTITNSGGPVSTYAISPALPTGLSMSASTGIISGTPSGSTSTGTFTITATGTSGLTTTTSLTVVVNNTACSQTTVTSGGYTIQKFLTTGLCSWTVPANITKADILVVGGGGAGGTRAGGGGGAGGYLYFQDQTLTPGQIHSVKVGAGGTANLTDSAGNGGDSSFGALTVAKGGGGGGGALTAGNTARAGKDGGSGGGAAGNSNLSGSTYGLGTAGQGNNGAPVYYSVADGYQWIGGGGGGSSSSGFMALHTTANSAVASDWVGGKGGSGTLNSITGTSVCYATGGGGGIYSSWTGGPAGDCGGAANPNGGAGTAGSNTPTAPTANTGAGGGASGYSTGADAIAANGASGIVVVRYITTVTITPESKTMTFGGSSPSLTYTVSPSVTLDSNPTCNVYANSDTSHTNPLTISSSSNAGTYKIYCSGGAFSLNNATVAYGADATLTISNGTALTPAIGAPTYASGVWTATITNFDSSFSWSCTATNSDSSSGTCSVNTSTGVITVTPGSGKTATATITTSKTNYSSGTLTTSSYYGGCASTSVTSGNYKVETISTIGTCIWLTPSGVTKGDVLVVGGGGGGAGAFSGDLASAGGGGGAGGVIQSNSLNLPSSVQITIGAGGNGGAITSSRAGAIGSQGGSTAFGTITAGGGGGGGCDTVGTGSTCATSASLGLNGTAAGSGGGASNYYNAYNSGTSGTASNATFNSQTINSQIGYRGGVYNGGGSSILGAGAPGGGARGDGNFNTPGAGFSSNISGSTVVYGLGGSTYGVSGWAFTSTASGYGTGGSGQKGTNAIGGAGAQGVVIIKYAATAITPTFDTPVRTNDGFTVNITNYDSNFTFTPTVSSGSVAAGTASGATLPLTVTGLTSGQSATVTVSTSANSLNGSATLTSSAKESALIPTFGSPTYSSGNYVLPITNYDANYSWTYSVSNGTYSVGTASGNTINITVTPTSGASATLTAIASRTGYIDGSATSTAYYAGCNITPSTSGGYTTYTFTTIGSCMWTAPSTIATSQVLIVGGGGGGGDSNSTGSVTGGSGGAGGYFASAVTSLSGTILVTVGAGGSGAASSTSQGSNGGDSALGTLLVGGGGGGSSYGYAGTNNGLSGNGGSTYVSSGNGGGGRSNGTTAQKTGGRAGAVASSGVTFLGNTYVGYVGSVGGTGDSAGSGGLGGAITAANRTSSISGSSVVYAKGGTYLPWVDGRNTAAPQTYGSGGSTNYNYGAAESAGYTLGGNGAQGIVIISYVSSTTITPTVSPTSINYGASTSVTASYTVSPSYTFSTNPTCAIYTSASHSTQVTNTSTAAAGTYYVYCSGASAINGPTISYGSDATFTINAATIATASSPTLANTSNTVASLTATWSSVSNATSYTVKVYPGAGGSAVATISNASSPLVIDSSNFAGIAAGQSYKVSVTAVGSGNYTSSSESSQSSAVTTLSNQSSISFTGSSGLYSSTITLSATGGSGTGQFSYSVVNGGTASGCSISVTTLSATSAGTCLVTATKAGDGNYLSATSSNITFTFNLTVTYDTQGGSAIASGTSTAGAQIAASPGTPTKSGYTFAGWFVNSSGGSAITFAYTHGNTTNFTLYAQWTVNTYTVTYDGNGNTGGLAPTDASSPYSYNSTVTVKSNSGSLTKTNYTFVGWNTAANGSGTDYQPSATFILGAADLVLYAKWIATCSVTADLSTNAGYTIYKFTSTTLCAWTVPSGLTSAEVLVVGGGGGGGYWGNGGGGGAGGLLYASSYSLTSGQVITLKVGTGGQGASTSGGGPGASGVSSVFAEATALGGGGGAGGDASHQVGGLVNNGYSGGSGGGGSSNNGITTSGGTTTQSAPNSSWAAFGSNGAGGSGNVGGGGGGAGGAGSTSSGGAGKTYFGTTFAAGGKSAAAAANTGSGGGASYSGAAGTVIVRVTNTYTVTYQYNSATGGNTDSSATYTTGGTAITLPTPTKTGYSFGGWYKESGFTNLIGNGGATYSPSESSTSLTIYAKWNASSLTVTFDAQGGTSVANGSTTTGGTVTAPTAPTRAGYTLSGWSTTSNGSTISFPYSHGQTSAFTLYAIWSANSLTITYDSKGGTAVTSGTTTTGSSIASAPTAPTKTGYTFAGWSATDGGSAVTFAYIHGKTADFTMYALWTAVNYTITYSLNGGSGTAPTETTKTIGQTFSVASIGSSQKSGYTFGGWSDGTSTYQAGTNNYTVGSANVVLTAQWNLAVYVVTYNSNSGSGSGSRTSENYSYGATAITLPSIGNLARTGYSFGGWSVSPGVSATPISGTYTPTASITLYAVWNPVTYTISFNSNGGGTGPNSVTYTTGGTTVTLPSVGSMAKTGYDFSGWATTASGSALSNTGYTVSADTTLYAKWTIKTISVTYSKGLINGVAPTLVNFPSNSSGTFGSNITISSTVDALANSNSYAFAGWSDGTSTFNKGDTYRLGENNVTLTAQWVAIYAVRYSTAGGSLAARTFSYDEECTTDAVEHKCFDTQPITVNADPTRSGYDFAGWKDQSGASIPSTPAGWSISATSYLAYATWTPINYKISYDSNGGSTGPADVNKNIGDLITVESSVTKTGYTFAGWRSNGVDYGPGATLQVGTSAITFQAQWTAINYTLVYDSNGGAAVATPTSTKTYQESFTTPSAPNRDGYTFSGWSDGSSTINASTSMTMPAGNLTLTAQWSPVNYSVTYDANGGTGAPSGLINRHIGDTFTVGAAATQANRNFLGWSDGTNTYMPGQSYVVGSSNVTLTATWSGQLYSITYAKNGASGNAPTETDRLENEQITVASGSGLSKRGYAFGGWEDGAGNTYQPGNSLTVRTSNLNLTAKWNATQYFTSYVSGTNASTHNEDTFNIGGSAITLPTPTRNNFHFDGWYDASSGGNKVGNGGEAHTPTSSRTLYGRWTQNSLVGYSGNTAAPAFSVNVADSATSYTQSASAYGSGVSLSIPAGALPNGTAIKTFITNNNSNASSILSGGKQVLLSAVISWLASDETVPDTDPAKPITVTVTNAAIKTGSALYILNNGVATYVGTATSDGTATFSITSDPEVVIAAVAPGAPTNVSGTAGNGSVSLTWSAPASNGGATITGYTVTSSPSVTAPAGCTNTASTSCTFTGLSNGTAYTFTVTATNSAGTSVASSSSSAVTPQGSTSVSITSSSTGTYGESQNIVATTSGASSGTAEFKVGGVTISGCAAVAVSSSTATCAWTPASADPAAVLTAVFTPSGNSSTPSTSSSINVNVGTRAITIDAADKTAAFTGSAVSVTNSYTVTSGTFVNSDSISSLSYSYSTANPTNVGTYTITPSGAVFGSGSASNYTITYTTGTLTISANALVITFGSAPNGVTLGESAGTHSVSATTSPSGIGTTTFASTTTSVCTVNSSTGALTILTSGVCTITADNSGDSNHTAAAQDTQTFNVAPIVITFNSNGAESASATQNVTSLNPVTLDSNTFTRSGYTFNGWNTVAGGSGTAYTDGASLTPSGSITLYAQWSVVQQSSGGGGSSSGSSSTGQSSGSGNVSKPAAPQGVPVTTVGDSSAKVAITLTGKITDASVPVADQKYVGKVEVIDGKLTLTPATGFSGKQTVTVATVVDGNIVNVQVALTVLPEPVKAIAATPKSTTTAGISWEPSPNALKYDVYLNGKKLCSTSADSCNFNSLVGPKDKVEIVAIGGDQTKSEKIQVDYQPERPVLVNRIVGSTRIKSTLSTTDKSALNKVIALIKKHGFTDVVLSQVSTTTATKAAADKRMEAIQKYIQNGVGKQDLNFAVVKPTKQTVINNISLK